MDVRGFIGRLTCIFLMTTSLCFSNPVHQQKSLAMLEFPGCPNYQIGENVYTNHVVVLDNVLTFLVKPSHPAISLDITVSSSGMTYQAVVDGANLKLEQCNSVGEQCEVLQEGASKSSDLLDVTKWNSINITLEGDIITVSVNRKKDVMGKLMSVVWEDSSKSKGGDVHQHSNVQVSIRPMQIPGYSALVNLFCDETHIPEIEEVTMEPPVTAVTPALPDPFPDCLVQTVKEGYPLEGLKLEDKLVLAVLPSSPSLQMKVSFKETLYQATLDGSATEVLKCSSDGTHCDMVDAGGVKGSDNLIANTWNFVTVSLSEGKVTFQVNSQPDLMRKAMSFDPNAEYATVAVFSTVGIPTDPSKKTDTIIRVNVYCEDDKETTVKPDFTPVPREVSEETTVNIHYTPAPIGDITEAPDTSPKETSNTLRIVIIILAIILAVILIALVYYCYREKCKKGNSQSSYQLQEENQQQH